MEHEVRVPYRRDIGEAGAAACSPGQGDVVRRILISALAVVALASACGSEDPDPTVLRAGQVDIKLPDGWTVDEAHAVKPPAQGEASSDGPTGGTGQTGSAAPATTTPPDTVPLSEDDPQTAFFKAARVFQQCMKDNGTDFIGVPDASNPDSPTNDPDYLSVLGTCASKSNIVQALTAMQAAQDSMTPAEIKQSNEDYLDWRECMIGRGWGIPEPKPDEKGRLFSFGGGGSGPPQFEPPAGQDPFSSPDFQECIEEVSD
jgi:hypothetical protein